MKKRLAVFWGIFAVLAGTTVVVAQSTDGFDPRAVEARAGEYAQDAQELFDFVTNKVERHRDDAQVVVEEGFEAIEDLKVGEAGDPGEPFDFDTMVAGAQSGMTRAEGSPLFLAFASLSMPDEALSRMVAETTAAGGVVVFRGFPADNPQGFAQRIRSFLDERGASNVAIDPRLFRSFSIDRVPTYVALSTDFELCDQLDCVTAPPPHDRISGNISVAYVLERFVDADGPGAPVSRMALSKLQRR